MGALDAHSRRSSLTWRMFLRGSLSSMTSAIGLTVSGIAPKSSRGFARRGDGIALLTPGRQVQVRGQMHPCVDQRALDLAVDVALARQVVCQVDVAGPEATLFAVAQLD